MPLEFRTQESGWFDSPQKDLVTSLGNESLRWQTHGLRTAVIAFVLGHSGSLWTSLSLIRIRGGCRMEYSCLHPGTSKYCGELVGCA